MKGFKGEKDKMNKKLILGSIIAVVIISLAGVTSVIGSQLDRSTVKETPLFGIRRQTYQRIRNNEEKVFQNHKLVNNFLQNRVFIRFNTEGKNLDINSMLNSKGKILTWDTPLFCTMWTTCIMTVNVCI